LKQCLLKYCKKHNNLFKETPPKLTLIKQTIIERIAEKNNQTPSQARDTVETLLEIMKETLASGEYIMISRFGKFCVNEKVPRKGRNPATGESMVLDGRRVVTFKLAGVLRDRINGDQG
jgi:integration host factor subunit alpha